MLRIEDYEQDTSYAGWTYWYLPDYDIVVHITAHGEYHSEARRFLRVFPKSGLGGDVVHEWVQDELEAYQILLKLHEEGKLRCRSTL
jgi:hypothetical protein